MAQSESCLGKILSRKCGLLTIAGMQERRKLLSPSFRNQTIRQYLVKTGFVVSAVNKTALLLMSAGSVGQKSNNSKSQQHTKVNRA